MTVQAWTFAVLFIVTLAALLWLAWWTYQLLTGMFDR